MAVKVATAQHVISADPLVTGADLEVIRFGKDRSAVQVTITEKRGGRTWGQVTITLDAADFDRIVQ